MSQILDTSITVFLWRRFYKWYGSVEEGLSYIYRNSRTHSLFSKFWEKLRICFGYSFLGRITEIREPNPALLNNSRTVKCLINFYKRWRDKVIHCSKASSTVNLAENTKEQFILSPAKLTSIIIVTAILANVVLSIILHKQIVLWGWLMRGLFLFAGVSALFCQADWPTIKKSSIFLRKAKIN